jgi:hypothetical protein
MDSRWWLDKNVIDVWFELGDLTAKSYARDERSPTIFRPPSLRNAIYAWVLARRTDAGTSPETVESYVNGIELGSMMALHDAWKKRHDQ